MQTLKSDTGAGDRLVLPKLSAKFLLGLELAAWKRLYQQFLQNVASSKPSVREGFMSLFIFLPVCFGNSFANYLSKIIPPILSGLADDVESIRDTSLRAGRLLSRTLPPELLICCFLSSNEDLQMTTTEFVSAPSNWLVIFCSISQASVPTQNRRSWRRGRQEGWSIAIGSPRRRKEKQSAFFSVYLPLRYVWSRPHCCSQCLESFGGQS